MCEEKVVIFISCDIASYHLLRVYDSPTPPPLSLWRRLREDAAVVFGVSSAVTEAEHKKNKINRNKRVCVDELPAAPLSARGVSL